MYPAMFNTEVYWRQHLIRLVTGYTELSMAKDNVF